jgi:hypothetical protein
LFRAVTPRKPAPRRAAAEITRTRRGTIALAY